MRTIIRSQPGRSYWLAFDKITSRNEAARRFRARGWYTLLYHDVAGPALHVARVWYTSPPCGVSERGMPRHTDQGDCLRHRMVGR